MPPDSLTIAAAVALFAACVGAWRLAAPFRAPARMPLRFAAMLLAALAVAAAVRLGTVTALLLLPLAGAALALSALARFARPAHAVAATAALMTGLGCGLAAMLTGHWIVALLPLAAAALCVTAAGFNGMAPVAMLSGGALLAAGLALIQNGLGAGSLLLCAAGVIGLGRSTPLVDHAWLPGRAGGIGGQRSGIAVVPFRQDLAQDLRDE